MELTKHQSQALLTNGVVNNPGAFRLVLESAIRIM
jgi:hypothetical protein